MCSAFALRPSLHAFACALTRRVYGVGLCMRRMSSAAASDPSHGDRALHEPFAIGGHVNPLPCVLCVGALMSRYLESEGVARCAVMSKLRKG